MPFCAGNTRQLQALREWKHIAKLDWHMMGMHSKEPKGAKAHKLTSC